MKLHNRVNGDELKRRMMESSEERTTISFYQYYQIRNTRIFRDHFYLLLDKLGVLGRIYVANEGVNGQMSVSSHKVNELREAFDTITFFQGIRFNYAIEDDGKSFFKLAIKIRDKILADGLSDESFDVTRKGTHVDAIHFNKLAEDPETVIIDMRNHYETEVGHFEGAITPDVETFRESLPIIEKILEDKKEQKILMYCTGGIRCEKASAYFKHKGFKNVFQLNGGIIEYANEVKAQNLENKFLGKNFVFDERLGEKIGNDVIAKCHQCGNACDTHKNCANDACHLLFIQCDQCAEKYENCCSSKCKDFSKVDEAEQRILRKTEVFNGTRFGKGRYKAFNKEHSLDIS